MPKTSFSRNQAVTVWGEARPAKYGGNKPAAVAIQFQANGKGAWKTRAEGHSPRPTSRSRSKFPSNGNVRLAYAYPKSDPLLPIGLAGTVIISRSQAITVR